MNNKIIAGLKEFFIDVALPIFIYIFVTIFVELIIEFVKNYFSCNINILVVTCISAMITSAILLPMYIKNIKKKQYIISTFEVKNIKYILGIGVSLCLFFNILLILLNIVQNDEEAKLVSENVMKLNPIIALIIVSVFVPFCEELIFRALIFKNIEHKYNFFLGSFISSLLFALLHGNISQGIYAFCIGFVLCFVYKVFGGLKASFLLHMIMNFSSLFFAGIFIHEDYYRKEQMLILIVSLVLFIITIYRINQLEIKKEDK